MLMLPCRSVYNKRIKRVKTLVFLNKTSGSANGGIQTSIYKQEKLPLKRKMADNERLIVFKH